MGLLSKLLGRESEPPAVDAAAASIRYFCTGRHRYTMQDYLDTWGAALQPIVEVVPYESLAKTKQLPSCTIIFSDVERLALPQRTLLADLWERLEASDVPFRLLNHPLRVKRRYELLRALHEQGRNSFTIYRLDEVERPLRRPVFVRHVNEHNGSLAGPFDDADELDKAIGALMLGGYPPAQLAVIEYCETVGEDGLYRKYSAFKVGDRIIPRHKFFGRDWMLKYPKVLNPDLIEEEWTYLRDNPHADQLLEIFGLAHIDYGRIDYSLTREGALQVWEINTNPMVMMLPDKYDPSHLASQEFFAGHIEEALRALAIEPNNGTVRVQPRLNAVRDAMLS